MFFNKTKKLLQQTQEQLTEEQQNLINTQHQLDMAQKERDDLIFRYKDLVGKDKAIDDKFYQFTQMQQRLSEVDTRYQTALQIHSRLESEISLYEDRLDIGSFGLYKPQHSFDTSEQYKRALDDNYEAQKDAIKAGRAVVCTTEWSVGGSKVEGRRMTNQYNKLMLLAFNGECDSQISKVKWNNAGKVKERIIKAFDNINKLGTTQQSSITPEFLDLKLQELSLTYEYAQKRQEEKEEQQRIREMMREEEKAQKEMERAQRDAEDEERRYQKALDKAKQELGVASPGTTELLTEQIRQLEERLKAAQMQKERAISMAQQTKVGHIYVISNTGSFGEDVYKIGMTRRLDPMDRIKELGDASVPFHFDVHAIIYSTNAPQLEYELHRRFDTRRLNRINNKKEFFKVSLDEIESFVKQHANAEIEFTKLAEAKEYRETLAFLDRLNKAENAPQKVSPFPQTLVGINE
jgi:hypothetical protein